MNKYIEYIKHIGGDKYLVAWAERVLPKHMEKPKEEVEHILDYLSQCGKKLERMSYEQAKKLADAWTKALQKKGAHIQEAPEDTEVVLDFGDGFRFVRLVGENAYKREGYLMRHCVASYYEYKSIKIYSLRDKNNIPHVTIEENKQIRGKGNSDVHPRYIDYVVRFLEHMGIEVPDDEMKKIGYVNIEELIEKVDGLDFHGNLYREKYYPKHKIEEITKDGEPYQSLLMWRVFGLIDKDGKFLFDYNQSCNTLSGQDRNILGKEFNTVAVQDDSALAGQDHNTIAGQDNNTIAGQNFNTLAGYSRNILAGEIYNTIAGKNRNTLVGENFNTIAGKNHNTLAGSSNNTITGQNFNTIAGRDDNIIAGREFNTISVKNGNIIATRTANIIIMDGEQNVAIGCNETVMCGKKGNVMVFVHYDYQNENGNIKTKTAIIDGKKFKEDTFYRFDGEKIIETNINDIKDSLKINQKDMNKAKQITENIKQFYVMNKNNNNN